MDNNNQTMDNNNQTMDNTKEFKSASYRANS